MSFFFFFLKALKHARTHTFSLTTKPALKAWASSTWSPNPLPALPTTHLGSKSSPSPAGGSSLSFFLSFFLLFLNMAGSNSSPPPSAASSAFTASKALGSLSFFLSFFDCAQPLGGSASWLGHSADAQARQAAHLGTASYSIAHLFECGRVKVVPCFQLLFILLRRLLLLHIKTWLSNNT